MIITPPALYFFLPAAFCRRLLTAQARLCDVNYFITMRIRNFIATVLCIAL